MRFGSTSLRDVEPFDHRAGVLGVVGDRGRFGAAAALPEAALVVAHGDEAGVGQSAGQLRHRRHTRGNAVPIRRIRAGEQDDSRKAGREDARL